MSFQTGLSGLNASSRNLDVIGNNIANANTTGMKSSRAEFSNLVASSLGVGSTSGAGIGVSVATVSQQFSQGNIATTGNTMDVAINGGGFFQLTQTDGSMAYTRDGSFKLDKDGFIINNSGANVMGFPTDTSGNITSASIQKLQLPTNAPIKANPTATITAEFNLDARALDATQATAAGKVPDPRSTFGTALNVFDQQGVPSPVNFFFVKKDGTANSWDIFGGIDGVPAGIVYPNLGTMAFDASGKIVPSAPPATGFSITLAAGTIPSANPNNAVSAGGTGFLTQPITLDLTNVTQYGTAFAVSSLTQDGFTAGDLTSISIGETGAITSRYSNGQSQFTGQITLADFRNVQGLLPLGGNAWAESFDSGLPVQGSPGSGKFGALRAGALEESNVDLTSELVNLMTAQRAYQANAQTIKTQDQVMSTLVNLR
ncbi:MAG: flagellar hook protein FlgE [Rhodoferax sp.]|nr:flagellar hook protein FlgE [Betaproteobacteria bacterium]NCN98075.1 flagellar hook protein FlgE [Rhodoferax sp.]OIP22059.1 MAG: flagellar biosynthesis protein FlgE [Comamonadaceae bacterium CG2_30_57_122]PIZ21653.1 MAG: flagellar hook protein FlgE [Comamonadaceae bacterium CG_4_10_14_0_8_um_filter_57_29]PJC14177.1 MAG: flagellar hook protein FlgE [Comamonadaceae bacterium CG_4_9_14_0_8_um_filter_57_21]